MIGKEVIDEDPGGTNGLRIVISSFVEEWLRVTVVRARINEYFAQPFRLFHGGEKIDGGLGSTRIFAACNHQNGTF